MKINMNANFFKCLKSYGADIGIIVECELDYPQAVLIHLKDRSALHFLTMTDRRGLRRKNKRYRNKEYVIKLQ